MQSLALAWDRDAQRADWQLTPTSLALGDALEAAVIVSLFTDRRARPDDKLKPGEDPRGWWGDAYAGRPIGSRLWLLLRSARTTETLRRAKDMIAEALQWLLDDELASRLIIEPEWRTRTGLVARITLIQQDGTPRVLTFGWLWDGSSNTPLAAGRIPGDR